MSMLPKVVTKRSPGSDKQGATLGVSKYCDKQPEHPSLKFLCKSPHLNNNRMSVTTKFTSVRPTNRGNVKCTTMCVLVQIILKHEFQTQSQNPSQIENIGSAMAGLIAWVAVMPMISNSAHYDSLATRWKQGCKFARTTCPSKANLAGRFWNLTASLLHG